MHWHEAHKRGPSPALWAAAFLALLLLIAAAGH